MTDLCAESFIVKSGFSGLVRSSKFSIDHEPAILVTGTMEVVLFGNRRGWAGGTLSGPGAFQSLHVNSVKSDEV